MFAIRGVVHADNAIKWFNGYDAFCREQFSCGSMYFFHTLDSANEVMDALLAKKRGYQLEVVELTATIQQR